MTNVAGARVRVRPRRSAQLPTCARPRTEAGGHSTPPAPGRSPRAPAPPPRAPPAPFPGSGRAAVRAQVGDTLTVSSFAGCSGSPERVRLSAAPALGPGHLPNPASRGPPAPHAARRCPGTPARPAPAAPHGGRGRHAHAHSHAHTHARPARTLAAHAHAAPRLARPPGHARCRRERPENEIYY